jgi:hypothetical protein
MPRVFQIMLDKLEKPTSKVPSKKKRKVRRKPTENDLKIRELKKSIREYTRVYESLYY